MPFTLYTKVEFVKVGFKTKIAIKVIVSQKDLFECHRILDTTNLNMELTLFFVTLFG